MLLCCCRNELVRHDGVLQAERTIPSDTEEDIAVDNFCWRTLQSTVSEDIAVDNELKNLPGSTWAEEPERAFKAPPLKLPDLEVSGLQVAQEKQAFCDSARTDYDQVSSAGTTFRSHESTREFQVLIERAAGTPLGLNLDVLDGSALVVSAVKAGPVRLYNDAVAEEEQIQPGDCIIAVNGIRGTSEALLLGLKNASLELLIKRPWIFSILIEKSYGPLGLQIEHASTGSSLLVKGVNPGLIRDWNLAHRGSTVKRRDRIVGVNDFQGSPSELLGRMKLAVVQGDRLELEIFRY
eukprot:CAMPEP_0115090566 /NCGR_PEP_ID=MMETSP0227-20121206/25513_1 /TAXON_ID=89957 /ORGANISM="Polarella glacialis, Strain CCMP 1383" /LENGTH=293 /DNA_ID=CAMNT_0002481751 /DNA_START=118 /DNA_END=999 /DNA_ORIENTATION=+